MPIVNQNQFYSLSKQAYKEYVSVLASQMNI